MTTDTDILPRLRVLQAQLNALIAALEAGESETLIDNHDRTSLELKKFEAGTILVGSFAIQDRFPKEEV